MPHQSLLSKRNAWRRKRAVILARDQYTCQYCFASLPADQLHLDHVIPRSRGGTYANTNLVASCQRCQLDKDDKTPATMGLPTWHQAQLTPQALAAKLAGVDLGAVFAKIRGGVYVGAGKPMRRV